MDEIERSEGPITVQLFDTALLSVWKVYDRLRECVIEHPEVFPGGEIFTDEEFLLKKLKAAWDDPRIDADAVVDEFWNWIESPGQRKGSLRAIFQVITPIIAYATLAMKAEQQGDFATGWRYVGEARYWEGILNGFRMADFVVSDELDAAVKITNPAALMAMRRHAGSAAEKERVVAYWEANIDPTLSAAKAATQIVTSGNFSLEFRTIQTVIAAARKARSLS
ncbi:hypothetical protein WM26_31060 [Burkholderia cepacia]|uniref:hypothetical protein n=1 Tax=Burkholderia cepacia TaxID=292 RepID=UPI00075F9BEB|nr:hypothetical protein [Burkholderia cepacia]KWO06047.1 hypothetical protein WM26_31060 [Burkholderia cepacia]